MPPSETKGRRHTSTVMVVAIEESVKQATVLRKADVREEFYKSSGAGGSHRNKTMSAVKLTHSPTGLTAISADERSQHQNREIAWKRLADRVTDELSGRVRMREADSKAEQFSLADAWVWVDYADEVRAPSGKRMAMKRALKGDLEKLLKR